MGIFCDFPGIHLLAWVAVSIQRVGIYGLVDTCPKAGRQYGQMILLRRITGKTGE